MRYNTRDLLSTPALAIAAMAISATNVDAQCPGGCFGYPTPNRPAAQSFARTTQYQPAIQVPAQTFMQTQTFAAAPQVAPVQSFVQPQQFVESQPFAEPQFAPVMEAPNQQTFASGPAIFSPMQTIQTPQYFPQPMGTTLPAINYYPIQAGIISSGQIAQPIISYPIGSPVIDSGDMADNSTSEVENKQTEQVQEGQIEGEIISPDDDSPALEITPGEIDQIDEDAADAEKAAKEKAEQLEAEKAAQERAAKKKAEELEAEKAKAEAAEMKSAEMKKAKLKAEKQKAAQDAKDKAKPKVLTDADKITRLEKSLQRQINRANQVAESELSEKLKQMKTDEASDADIAAAQKDSSDALQEKIETIQKRVGARIEALKQ